MGDAFVRPRRRAPSRPAIRSAGKSMGGGSYGLDTSTIRAGEARAGSREKDERHNTSKARDTPDLHPTTQERQKKGGHKKGHPRIT